MGLEKRNAAPSHSRGLHAQEFGYGGFIQLEHSASGKTAKMMRDDGHFFRDVESNLWEPEQRIKEMDATGTRGSPLSAVHCGLRAAGCGRKEAAVPS